MAENIALQANVRTNLNAVQDIDKKLNITSERLSTGKDVNKVIDNPTNFFASRSLNDRADSLNARLDGLGNAVQTINAATNGIDGVRNLLANAKALIDDALAESSAQARQEIGEQFNTLLDQAALIAKDSSFRGTNLLRDNQDLNIQFAENAGDSELKVKGLDIQGPGENTNGRSSVSVQSSATRASEATSGSVASNASQASVASVASSASSGSVESRASIASQVSVASGSTQASQGSVADDGSGNSQASIGSAAGSVSQDSVASQAAIQSEASSASSASVASQAEFFSNASEASSGSVASANVTFTQEFAFTLQGDPNDEDSVVGLKKASTVPGIGAAFGQGVNSGEFRIDFGSDRFKDELTSLSQSIDKFDEALATQNARLATNLNVVNVRQDFTDGLINTLEAGADDLVLADTEEEGANLTALQTRQQLATQTLAISSQQNQNVLRLLG